MKVIPENNFDDIVSEIIDFFAGSNKYNCVTSILEKYTVEADLVRQKDAQRKMNEVIDDIYKYKKWGSAKEAIRNLIPWDGK